MITMFVDASNIIVINHIQRIQRVGPNNFTVYFNGFNVPNVPLTLIREILILMGSPIEPS